MAVTHQRDTTRTPPKLLHLPHNFLDTWMPLRLGRSYRNQRIELIITASVGPVWSGQHLEHNAQRQNAPTHSTHYFATTIEGKTNFHTSCCISHWHLNAFASRTQATRSADRACRHRDCGTCVVRTTSGAQHAETESPYALYSLLRYHHRGEKILPILIFTNIH